MKVVSKDAINGIKDTKGSKVQTEKTEKQPEKQS